MHKWPAGAIEHALPLRQWRATWPAVYDTLYQRMCEGRPDGSGVREFLRVLALHEGHVAADIEQAVKEALACGSAHFEGIKLCLHRLQHPDHTLSSVFLLPAAQQPRLPSLEWTGVQAADLQRYDRFLTVEADTARIQVMA